MKKISKSWAVLIFAFIFLPYIYVSELTAKENHALRKLNFLNIAKDDCIKARRRFDIFSRAVISEAGDVLDGLRFACGGEIIKQ